MLYSVQFSNPQLIFHQLAHGCLWNRPKKRASSDIPVWSHSIHVFFLALSFLVEDLSHRDSFPIENTVEILNPQNSGSAFFCNLL